MAIYIPARMTIPMNTNGVCSFYSFSFTVYERVYGIGGYYRLGVLLLFQFGFIISDDIFVTDDGNGVCVSSVRLPW